MKTDMFPEPEATFSSSCSQAAVMPGDLMAGGSTAITEGSALAIYLDWINLLSKRHPASLERHVRTMIKAVQRLHRRDDTELQRGQQGLSLAA